MSLSFSRPIVQFAGAALLVIGALVLPALALAQAAAPNPDDLGQILGVLVDAVSLTGPARWFSLLFGGVFLVVWAIRRVVPATTAIGRFVRSDEGGTLVGWLVSACGALLTKALVGTALTWPMAGAALVAAAGGTGALWSQARRLLRLLSPLVAMIPKIGPALASVLDVISGASAKAEIAKATAAAYQPQSPAPTAKDAAAQLGAPPVL
jgi:hypothetical protein